jgi:CubicO group peptidase (beta-lactamase class C family)
MNSATLAIVVALALCLPTVAPSEDLTTENAERVGFSTIRLARIGAWYQARVEAGEVTGAVVAIAKGNDLAYLQADGFQDRARTIPMKPDSIFWIGDMTKPIISVAAMILMDEGKLDLDAPVARYLPELKDMLVAVEEINPATGEAAIKPVPPERPMTVRDLLRHTSGLVYSPPAVWRRGQIYPPQYFDTPSAFVASLADIPPVGTTETTTLVHQPGRVWEAHQPGQVWADRWGVDADLLARVVEVASSQPFDQFLANRIFSPLKMVDTGFYVPEAKRERVVQMSDPLAPPFDVMRPRKLLSVGGGLVSTVVDYLRFAQMLLNGGELDGARILSAKTVDEMTTNSLPHSIQFADNAFGPSTGSSWGLGFAVRTDPTSSDIPGSVGSYTVRLNGFYTWRGGYFWIDPAERLIAIQMIHFAPGLQPDFDGTIRNLTYGSLRVSEQSVFVPPQPPVAWRPGMLADYAGKYDFGASSSSRDKLHSPFSSFVGVGMKIEPIIKENRPQVRSVLEDGPAAKAGIEAGDVITEIDDVPVQISQFFDKLRGAVNSQVRLKIARPGVDHPIDLVVTRTTIHDPPVALQVKIDKGKLVAEAIGTWPILDFEKGKPVALIAVSDDMFYVDGDDHTRIAFVRDAAGRVSDAILDPGPWEQRGAHY